MLANYEKFEPFFIENLETSWRHGGLFEHLQMQQRLPNPHQIPNPNSERVDVWENWLEDVIDKPTRVRELVEANRNSLIYWMDAYYKDNEGHGMNITIIEPSEIIS